MSATITKFPSVQTRPQEPPGDRLISETDVLQNRPMLARGILRGARKTGRIRWTRGKRGSAWYTLADVDAYLRQEREIPCRVQKREPYSNSADNGLAESLDGQAFTDTGMTPELVASVALASAQRILNPPRSALRKSS